jgi:hypothetical protein
LGHPLIRDTARTEWGGLRRPQIVNPKIGNLCTLQSLVPNDL